MIGGKREGAGRPKKYGEPIERLVVYCPKSKKSELNKFIKNKLKEYENSN